MILSITYPHQTRLYQLRSVSAIDMATGLLRTLIRWLLVFLKLRITFQYRGIKLLKDKTSFYTLSNHNIYTYMIVFTVFVFTYHI